MRRALYIRAFAGATLFFLTWSPLLVADEPGWTDQQRLENRDMVCLATVLSTEKVGTIDEHADVYLAVIEINGMKKGKKISVGSKFNVYYEAAGERRSKRHPARVRLAKGEKATFYLRNITNAIQEILHIKIVKEPALFVEMASDVQKIEEILKVNDESDGSVIISAGSGDGAALEGVFSVYRDQQPIGRLSITEVRENESTATITMLQGVAELAPSDLVAYDGTLQFLVRMNPDSITEAPETMARGFAAGDIGRGRLRVLYYGKPWSQGMPFVDDETKYAVTLTDGCAVSKDFTRFVDEYNLAMREHFKASR